MGILWAQRQLMKWFLDAGPPRMQTHQVKARTRVYSMALDCVREVDNVRVSRCSSHRRYYRLWNGQEREFH